MSTAPTPLPEADWLRDLLARHLRRYPLMAAADVYKLLHQSAMGPGHAVTDPDDALRRLQAEAAALGPDSDGEGGGPWPAEPLLEPIGPPPAGQHGAAAWAGAGLVRVHLRPWLRQGLPPGALGEAFVATAAAWRPEPDALAARLAAAVALAAECGQPADWRSLAGLALEMAARAYPALRHSAAYRAAYGPAYRVVDARHLATGHGPR